MAIFKFFISQPMINARLLLCANTVLDTGRVMNSCTYARIGAAVMNEIFSLVPNGQVYEPCLFRTIEL